MSDKCRHLKCDREATWAVNLPRRFASKMVRGRPALLNESWGGEFCLEHLLGALELKLGVQQGVGFHDTIEIRRVA